MPQVSYFYGIHIMMYLPEHNPPHFHVRYEGYHASIDINNGDIIGNMPRRAIRLVYEWMDLHKEELLENWNRLQKGMPIVEIEPLR